MKKAILAGVGAATAVLFGFAFQAGAATLDGSTVDFQYYSYGGTYDGFGSPTDFVAPGGSATFDPYFTVSVAGDQITYTYNSDTTWSPSSTSLDSGGLYIDNGSLLSFTGAPSITSVSIDAASQLGASGFNAGDVTFNSGAVAVTWMNQTFAAGDTVILDVNTGVPEPMTWALMLVGFGGLGTVIRAQRRADRDLAAPQA